MEFEDEGDYWNAPEIKLGLYLCSLTSAVSFLLSSSACSSFESLLTLYSSTTLTPSVTLISTYRPPRCVPAWCTRESKSCLITRLATGQVGLPTSGCLESSIITASLPTSFPRSSPDPLVLTTPLSPRLHNLATTTPVSKHAHRYLSDNCKSNNTENTSMCLADGSGMDVLDVRRESRSISCVACILVG